MGDLVALSELLLSASPLVIAAASGLGGWMACQRLAVKPLLARYEADLKDKSERIAALETREAELLRIALRKMEGG